MSKPEKIGENKSAFRQCRHEDDLRRLFERARKGDAAAMSALLAEFSRIALTVASGLVGRLDRSTLEDQAKQALRLAILDADLNDITKFRGFARTYIRNDLVDLIRELSDGSRSEYEAFAEFESAKQVLRAQNGVDACSDAAIYEYLGWGQTKRQNFQMSRRSKNVGDLSESHTSRDNSQRAMEIRIEREKRMAIAHDEMRRLPEPQRTALERRFYGSMSRKAFAKSLGETEHEIRKREELGLAAIKDAIEENEA